LLVRGLLICPAVPGRLPVKLVAGRLRPVTGLDFEVVGLDLAAVAGLEPEAVAGLEVEAVAGLEAAAVAGLDLAAVVGLEATAASPSSIFDKSQLYLL